METPIHQPPHFSLPLFSICLHYQTFISAASSWLDCTFYYNSPIISFRLVSSEVYYWNWITCFMITGLTRWCASVQQGRKLWHYSWRHISISFRAFLDVAATANANNNFSQFLWLFFTANYEWDRIFGSSCKTAHAAQGFEPRWRHSQSCQLSPGIGCGSLVVLDLQAALSTSLLFFLLFIFFFHGGILDSNCSVEENAFNNSHPQLLTSCMNERMCCKWSVPKCGISI